MRKIIRNAIRCNHCGDVIESTYIFLEDEKKSARYRHILKDV